MKESSKNQAKPIAFVISQIGVENSKVRKYSDQVFEFIIQPAADNHGFDTIRADHIAKPGIITDQIIQQLLSAELVIADLSGRNPNVFYELAFRHGAAKPVIHLCNIEETIPFDLSGMRLIRYAHDDWKSIKKCRIELENQIQSVKENPDDIRNPISVVLELQHLRNSAIPTDQVLGEILSSVREMSSRINRLEQAQTIGIQWVTEPSDLLTSSGFKLVTPESQGHTVFRSRRPYGDVIEFPDSDEYLDGKD